MTIICGSDFSAAARDALRISTKIGIRTKQEVLLLHAVVPRATDPVGVVDFEPLRAAMADALERQAAEYRNAGCRIATRAVIGWPEEAILHAAEETDADLIVLGALGHHGIVDWLIGRTAERVAQNTRKPLLLIRDPKPLETWLDEREKLRVLLATDFSPVSDFALDFLPSLEKMGPCEVILEHVANPAVDAARLNLHGPISRSELHPIVADVVHRELDRRAAGVSFGAPVSTMVKVSMGTPDVEIVKTAAEENAAVIVVGMHQRTRGERIVRGTVAKSVIRDARTNIICVPFHTADEAFRALEAPKIRTILAATDFSACGNHAVGWAMAIAPPKANVVICNVAADEEARKRASSQIALIEHPRSWPDNVAIAVDVAQNGGVAKAIWAQAQLCGADLIVVGAHGQSGLQTVVGSTARDLLALSAKPVLVVRDQARD